MIRIDKAEKIKDQIKELREQGLTLVDMHTHTRYSDGRATVKQVLAKAKKYGFGLAITDHNEIQGVLDAQHIKGDILVIPGIEVTVEEGAHILMYFYKVKDLEDFFEKHIKPYRGDNPWMATNLKLKDLVTFARQYKCIIGAAHPFAVARTGFYKCMKRKDIEKKLITEFDFIEAINGINLKKYNDRAIELTQRLNKPYVAGSDAHITQELGKVLTVSHASGIGSFLDSILAKENFLIGKEFGVLTHLLHHTTIAQRHMTYPKGFAKAQYSMVKRRVGQLRKRVIEKVKKRLFRKKTQS